MAFQSCLTRRLGLQNATVPSAASKYFGFPVTTHDNLEGLQCCDEHAEKVQSHAALKQRKYYPPCLTEFHLKSRLRFHTLQHYFCTPFSQLLHLPFFRQKGKLCTPYTLASCRTFISSGPFLRKRMAICRNKF